MKALLGSGLCLALGLVAAQTYGEEIHWRPVAPQPSAPVVQTSSAAVSPNDGAGISLSRPVGLEAPPLVRAKSEPDVPKSLPVGPEVKGGDKGPVLIVSDDPKPMPRANGEFIPPLPRPMGAGLHGAVSSDDCCDSSICGRLWGRICGWRPFKNWFGHDACCDSGCDSGSPCGGSDCCPARPSFWVSGSYLSWGFQHQDIPPLLTAINPAGAVPARLTLFDGNTLSDNFRNGGRFNLGFWLPRHSDWGFETSLLYLGKKTDQFSTAGDGSANSPTLARIIINADTGLENALAVAVPGVAGSFTVDTFSRLWGIDANVRHKLACGPRSWVDLLFGYKHLYLEEGLNITDVETALSPVGVPLVTFTVAERFRTLNEFNGGQIGIQAERRFFRRWFVQGTLKVALGNMHQTVDIDGSTTRVIPGGPTDVAPGGILALPTNIGRHSRDTFAVIPEAGLKIGYDVSDHWRVWVGYDFLYASSVVRPGDQIDLVVNRTQIPFNGLVLAGAPRPAVLFQRTSFWTQGVSAGLEYRW